MIQTRNVRCFRIFCPVERSTLPAVAAGEAKALELDPLLAPVLAVVRGDNALGDFGIYQSVIEMGVGWEAFVPGADASPTLGVAGAQTLSPTVILTVYAPAEADVEEAVAAIMAAHPWEVPVVEMSEVKLVVRG